MKNYKITLLFITIVFSSLIINAQTDCATFTLLQDDVGVAGETFGVSLADFNGDGWNDVVTIDAYNDIEVYFWDVDNNRMGTTVTSLGGDAWRFGVEVIDIENDGDWDFVTSPFSSTSGNGIEVWENDGTGNFTLKADGVGGTNNSSGYEFAVGDLNGDGYTDIFYPGGDLYILLNDGNGNFTNNGQDISVSSAEDVVLADFDNDNDLDAAIVRGGGSGFVGKVFVNDGIGQFTDTGQEITAGNSEGIDAADIDGDGDIDIVVAPWHGNVWLKINDGVGNYLPGDTLFDVGSSFYNDVILFDQNFDGYPDIITDKHIWLNNADDPGNFILQDFTMSVSTHDFEVIDMNNDILPDIYMGRFSSSSGDNIYLCDEPTYYDIDTTICFGDSLFVVGEWQTEPGIFLENAGCATYTRTTLSFYDEINTEVIDDEGTLTATATEAEYQWLDCDDDFAIIDGETAQSYTPTVTGNYAVEITQNGTCVDTSECYNVIVVNININKQENISIYPNPTTGIFNLEASLRPSSVTITNITGRTIYMTRGHAPLYIENTPLYIENAPLQIDISTQPSGIYLLKIQTEKTIIIEKIIKN